MSDPKWGVRVSDDEMEAGNLRAVLQAEGVSFAPTADGREIARPSVRRGREAWTRRALMALGFEPWGNSTTWIRDLSRVSK